jgi:hypothetical protein
MMIVKGKMSFVNVMVRAICTVAKPRNVETDTSALVEVAKLNARK